MFATNRVAVAIASILLAAVSSPAISQGISAEDQKNLDQYQSEAFASALNNPSSDVAKVLSQLRAVILKVQDTLGKDENLNLQLKNVQISLATGFTWTVGGQVVFFIFTIGPSYSSATTQTIKFALAPPPTPPKGAAPLAAGIPNFSSELTEAILTVAAAANAALKNPAKPALEMCNFTADIKFVIQYVVQGGIKIPVLLPISLNVTGEVNPSTTHEAILTFERKAPPKECAGAGGGGGGG